MVGVREKNTEHMCEEKQMLEVIQYLITRIESLKDYQTKREIEHADLINKYKQLYSDYCQLREDYNKLLSRIEYD